MCILKSMGFNFYDWTVQQRNTLKDSYFGMTPSNEMIQLSSSIKTVVTFFQHFCCNNKYCSKSKQNVRHFVDSNGKNCHLCLIKLCHFLFFPQNYWSLYSFTLDISLYHLLQEFAKLVCKIFSIFFVCIFSATRLFG